MTDSTCATAARGEDAKTAAEKAPARSERRSAKWALATTGDARGATADGCSSVGAVKAADARPRHEVTASIFAMRSEVLSCFVSTNVDYGRSRGRWQLCHDARRVCRSLPDEDGDGVAV